MEENKNDSDFRTKQKNIQTKDEIGNTNTSILSVLRPMLKCLFVLSPVLLLSAFGAYSLRATSDQLLYVKFGGEIKQEKDSNSSVNSSSCVSSVNHTTEDEIQANTAHFKLYMQLASCVVALFFVPLWGALSDEKGRYIALIACSVGAMIKTSSLLAVSVNINTPLWVLIVGEALHSIFGKSTSGILMVCAAYVADVIPVGKRAVVMIAVDFILMSCVAGSEYAAGVWIKAAGFTPLLIFAISLQGALFLYSIFVFSRVPKPVRENSTSQESKFEKVKNYLLKSLRTYSKPRESFIRACLLLMVCMIFFQYIAMYGEATVVTIYALGPPLCWSSVMLGIYSGVSTAVEGSLGIIIALVFIRAGESPWLVLAGLLSGTAKCFTLGFAESTSIMWIALVCGSLRVLVPAVTRAILCDLVEPTEFGAAMGGYVITSVVAELISHTMFNSLYAATVASFSRTSFFVAAGIFTISIWFLGGFAILKKRSKEYSKKTYSPLIEDSTESLKS